ncbi:hypothetical protein RUND412_011384 [Rhizina undulata]
MPKNTIKTRLLLVSDTHNNVPTPKSKSPFRKPLPKCDVLIHAGDMTNLGRLGDYEKVLSWIKEVDAELKLVIAGNHDLTLDQSFYAENWDRFHGQPEDAAKCLSLFTDAKEYGVHYLPEGSYEFVLSNGAKFKIHASPYQPEYGRWGFNYDHDLDRWNPLKDSPTVTAAGIPPVPEDIDILVTHGPPQTHHDTVVRAGGSVGCPHLRKAVWRTRPRLHVFGHIHEAFGVSRVQWNPPDNFPWDGTECKEVEKRRRLLESPGWDQFDKWADERKGAGSWEVDVSSDAGDERLGAKGEETLFVNASIVSWTMRTSTGGVLVDMELPVNEE